MASIEITEENPINVSLGEENTLTSSVSSPETVSVTSTDGWYEKKYEEIDPIFEKSPASDITNEDIENWNNKSDFSGDYNDLENKPTIPTKTSDLTNDSGFLTEHQDISGKVDKETGKGLSTNDFTNAYKSNVDSNTTARHTHSNKSVLDDISSNDVSNWDSKQDGLISGTNIKTINNESILGSGNITIQGGGGSGDGDMLKSVYDTNDNGIVDNAEKVNNHTVGTDVPSNAVFTDTVYDDTSIRQELNDKADSSDIPTKTSDLTNDSGFLTQHQDISGKVDKETGKGLSTNDFTTTYKNNVDSNTSARHTHSNKSVLDGISSTDITNWNNKSTFSGSYNDLTNKPTIPSKTSDLTNDSGFLTSETDPTVPSWAKQNTKPSYQATEVSVDGSNLEEAGTSMVAIRSATETQEALRYISRAVKYNKEDIDTINNTSLPAKQNTLVSGTNIKTINSNSLLGSGDISFETIQDISESSVHIKNLSAGIYRIYGSCDVYYNSTGSLSVPSMACAYLIVTEYPDLYTTNNNWVFIGNGYPEFCYGYSWNNGGYCYNVTSKETQEAITGLLSNLTTTSKTNLVSAINELDSGKQDTLVSGTNIKTVNGNSIVGSGDLDISVTGVDTRYATLWTGTWSSGSITVPNADKYYSFLVYVDSSRDPIPCYKDGNGNILGSVALGSASNSNNYAKMFRAKISGTTLTLNYARELAHYASGNHNAGENKTIYKIVGLDPIASTGNVAVTDLENVIADYITETNSNGTWSWRIWKSGRVELLGRKNYTGLNITTSSMGTWYGGSGTMTLPFSLSSVFFIGEQNGARGSGVYAYYTSISGTSLTTQFRAHASSTNASIEVSYYIIGQL